MADLEAVAAFLDINEQYDLAMAFDRDEEGNASMAREHRKSAACHRAAAAACRELIKHRLVDDESQPHPCPDHALRASYRDAARKLRKKTDAALAEIE